jgi:peptidylprolyl isomerase
MLKKSFLICIAIIILTGCTQSQPDQPISQTPEVNMPQSLGIEDILVGNGQEATSGSRVTVHYTGTLQDGTKFDSSVDRNQPFTFNLGAGEVIKGWDQGVAGMKAGGQRKLIIPSDLAYGNRSIGIIPPNSTLIFNIELLQVDPAVSTNPLQ